MWLGLDYAGVEAVIRLGGYRRPRRLFQKIQVLEQGALGVLNGKTA